MQRPTARSVIVWAVIGLGGMSIISAGFALLSWMRVIDDYFALIAVVQIVMAALLL